jgi:hypothetical protein
VIGLGGIGRTDFVDASCQFVQRRIEANPAANGINRFESAGGDQPRHGIRGHAGGAPLLYRCDKSFVQGLFRQIEIAQQANERRIDSSRLSAVDFVDDRLCLRCCIIRHHFTTHD